MLYAIALGVVLALAIALLAVSEFAKGVKTQQTAAWLRVITIGALILQSRIIGLWGALLLGSACLVYRRLVRAPAAKAAAYLFSIPDRALGPHRYVGLPPHRLERISRELGREIPIGSMFQNMMDGDARHERALAALLDYCESSRPTRAVMQQEGLSRESLRELYSQFCLNGGGQWATGHWAPASAIAYPETLQHLSHAHTQHEIERRAVGDIVYYFQAGQPLPRGVRGY